MQAKIIEDSYNSITGDRLTTFVLKFPRIVLAEFNTHRALSRNSASSRAIPFKKMLKMVLDDPFIPLEFLENHTGMQGSKKLEGWRENVAKLLWLNARNFAVLSSFVLNKFNVTKQLCNRILEPFMWHTVIASGTDWENFFKLRYNENAEIHIAKLAELMLNEYNNSQPKLKKPIIKQLNDFDSPINFLENEENLKNLHIPYSEKMPKETTIWDKIKISVARCARVSYLTQDGKIDKEKDIDLYNRLVENGHWSPLEHVAIPIEKSEYFGNFKGWVQVRKLHKNENQKDSRVNKIKL